MANDKAKRGQPDRSKINMHEDHEVKYWTRHFGITQDQLRRAVDRVCNSVAAVRKQLGNVA